MIITQTHKRRTFIGSMNAGTDLIEGLKSICVDNTIFCGVFTAVGYLRDVTMRSFDAGRKRYYDPTTHEGVFHAVSLRGNISLVERQTAVRCHAIGAVDDPDGSPSLHSGEVLKGEIISIEFTLETADDIRLYRAHDERSGLDPWLHVEFEASGPPSPPTPTTLPVRTPLEAQKTTPRAATAPTKAPEQQELDIRPGDHLNHPTLGRCEVVGSDSEDRLTIRLESGRVVELHLGLLELTPLKSDDGQRLFKVSIRRRRG